jgi:hypothetical protein
MTMSIIKPFVNIDDLPDEILLNVFKRLHGFDVLYSLVGVNRKLDNVACDACFTRTVDLTTILSNKKDVPITNAILDRFSMEILPRIRDKMECLIVEACFFQRVVRGSNYLNLRKLTLLNLKLKMACKIFNGMLLDFSMFKE